MILAWRPLLVWSRLFCLVQYPLCIYYDWISFHCNGTLLEKDFGITIYTEYKQYVAQRDFKSV
jgi:hypothetical protein